MSSRLTLIGKSFKNESKFHCKNLTNSKTFKVTITGFAYCRYNIKYCTCKGQ